QRDHLMPQARPRMRSRRPYELLAEAHFTHGIALRILRCANFPRFLFLLLLPVPSCRTHSYPRVPCELHSLQNDPFDRAVGARAKHAMTGEALLVPPS